MPPRRQGAKALLLSWTKFFAARTAEELEEPALEDPAVSKARDTLHRLSGDPDARRMAEERERAQITRGIEDGALRAEALEEGRLRELRGAARDLCELAGVDLNDKQRARLEAMSVDALVALKAHVKVHRAWP